MGKGNMAKRVLVLTAVVFTACLCSGYALTLPGIDRLYGWLGIAKNDRAGEGVSAAAKSPATPTPMPTFTPGAKPTPTEAELRAMLDIVPLEQPEWKAEDMIEAFPPPVWPPIDGVDWVSFGQLECEGIPVGNGQSKLYRHPVPYTGTEGTPTPYPDGKPNVLLKLKGNYGEMGYAHGWALAYEIWDLWKTEVKPHVQQGMGSWYYYLSIPTDVKNEMIGIKDGVNARREADNGGTLAKENTLTEEDIFVFNAFGWFALDCSSFSRWQTGQPILGRNTDCIYSDTLWRYGLVISREPDVGGHKRVVEFSVPGRIAAACSINQDGLGFLGHAPAPALSGYRTDHCMNCGVCCKPMALSVLEILHTQSGIDSLITRAREDSIAGGIYHIFGKRDSQYAVTCVEASGVDEKVRGRVSGDPTGTLVVTAGCAKAWNSCSEPGAYLYGTLVNFINNYAPNNDLDAVLRVMWGTRPNIGQTFQRIALKANSIPDGGADIWIILNVRDDYLGYTGKGLKVSWDELF